MPRYLIILLAVLLTACAGQDRDGNQAAAVVKGSSNDNYVWEKVLDSAAWKKSYNFQMMKVKDTLWTFHPDGNWYSVNGKNWTKSTLPNAINNLAFLDYVLFNDVVYGLGHFEGNIESFTLRPEIYKTNDLLNWQTIAKNSNLPRRFFYHPFVFDHKIWIIGGADSSTQYADVWNSPDGMVWTRQKDNLPFGKRIHSQVVELNGRLFLINNDVWSSADGLNWTQLTDNILKGEEVTGTAIVYDNKIWLLGCNRNGKFSSEVFVSADGKIWEGQDAPWSPRGGIAAAVFNGKLYITGGKYGGFMKDGVTTEFVYSNDVWTLRKKE